MSRTAFHRPARLNLPDPPVDRIGVPAPPPRMRGRNNNMWLTLMLPLFSTIAMAGYLISYQRPLLIVLGSGFVVLSVLSTVAIRWQMTHSQDSAARRQRDRYFEMLDEVRDQARAVELFVQIGRVGRSLGLCLRTFSATESCAVIGTPDAEREQLFRDHGIGSIVEFRQRRDAGALPPGTRTAALFLVIDNWAALRADSDDYDAQVVELAARGLGVGVHVVLTGNRWVEIRANLRDSIGGRLELRLNDPFVSEVGRNLARQLATAGRGVVAPGAFFQVALPRLGGETDLLAGLSAAQAKLLSRLDMAWAGRPRATGTDVARADPREGSRHPRPIGDRSGRDRPRPRRRRPHPRPAAVRGRRRQRIRQSSLRTWMRALTATVTGEQARFMIVDYRRGLLDVVPEGYIGAYAGDEHAADGLLLSGDPREGALLGGVRPSQQPPGRGVLVRRGQSARLIQVAIEPDDEYATR
jgi:hypothetical protein